MKSLSSAVGASLGFESKVTCESHSNFTFSQLLTHFVFVTMFHPLLTLSTHLTFELTHSVCLSHILTHSVHIIMYVFLAFLHTYNVYLSHILTHTVHATMSFSDSDMLSTR